MQTLEKGIDSVLCPEDYGITRVDQPQRSNHGWYVRVRWDGEEHCRFFADLSCGGKERARALADDYRNALWEALPEKRQRDIARRRTNIEQSGIVGVTHVINRTENKVYEYWQFAAKKNGRKISRRFSINKYGDVGALEMAISAKRQYEDTGRLRSG